MPRKLSDVVPPERHASLQDLVGKTLLLERIEIFASRRFPTPGRRIIASIIDPDSGEIVDAHLTITTFAAQPSRVLDAILADSESGAVNIDDPILTSVVREDGIVKLL